jgi:hypothetical protein
MVMVVVVVTVAVAAAIGTALGGSGIELLRLIRILFQFWFSHLGSIIMPDS